MEVIDSETGDLLTNVRVMYITINAFGKPSAEVTITGIDLDLEMEDAKQR